MINAFSPFLVNCKRNSHVFDKILLYINTSSVTVFRNCILTVLWSLTSVGISAIKQYANLIFIIFPPGVDYLYHFFIT